MVLQCCTGIVFFVVTFFFYLKKDLILGTQCAQKLEKGKQVFIVVLLLASNSFKKFLSTASWSWSSSTGSMNYDWLKRSLENVGIVFVLVFLNYCGSWTWYFSVITCAKCCICWSYLKSQLWWTILVANQIFSLFQKLQSLVSNLWHVDFFEFLSQLLEKSPCHFVSFRFFTVSYKIGGHTKNLTLF